MSLFKSKANDSDVTQEKDTLGGSRLFNSGIVDFIIESAFITFSAGGAMAFNAHLKDKVSGNIFRVLEWVTSGDEKGNKNTYTNDKGTFYLPGYNIANAITQLAADMVLQDISEDDLIVKNIKLWNGKEKKEVITEVNMVEELIGKPITVGVLKCIVDKTAKNDAGKYVATGETREENQIGKIFHTETGFTVQELKAGVEEGQDPKFRSEWAEKYTDQVQDKSSKDAKATKGAPGAATAPEKKSSLFPSKK